MIEQLDRLQVTSAITGTPIEVKEIVGDWILLTYDIPCTPEGDKARREFLRTAFRLGALPHTESVYLLPWSPAADFAMLEVAAAGQAFVWYSKAKDEEQARKVTRSYDDRLSKVFREVEKRVAKITEHLADSKFKLCVNMLEKTYPMLDGLEKASVARGSLSCFARVKELWAKYEAAKLIAETGA